MSFQVIDPCRIPDCPVLLYIIDAAQPILRYKDGFHIVLFLEPAKKLCQPPFRYRPVVDGIGKGMPALPEEEPDKTIPADQPLTRAQLTENLARLRDLRNAGILTEEEYNRKKTELYSRLG